MGNRLNTNFGTVPDWVSAIGTIAALFSGIWVFYRQQKQTNAELELARQEVEKREEERRARQASCVTVWADIQPAQFLGEVWKDPEIDYERILDQFRHLKSEHLSNLVANDLRLRNAVHPMTEDEFMRLSKQKQEAVGPKYRKYAEFELRYGDPEDVGSVGILVVLVSNTSDDPIFTVTATCEILAELPELALVAGLHLQPLEIPVIPPREGRPPQSFPIRKLGGEVTFARHRGLSPKERTSLAINLQFTDAANSRWRRNANGRLSHLDN